MARFECESREVFAERATIVAWMSMQSSDDVVGAGTGSLFACIDD